MLGLTPRDLRFSPAAGTQVVGLETLLGLADGAAEVPGLGPIPVDLARALAAEGTWRAWITDTATGSVIATGSRRYNPGAALARLVRAR